MWATDHIMQSADCICSRKLIKHIIFGPCCLHGFHKCSSSALRCQTGQWDSETTKIKFLNNNVQDMSLDLHTSTDVLLIKVEIIEVNTQWQLLLQKWNSSTYWWRVLCCHNRHIHMCWVRTVTSGKSDNPFSISLTVFGQRKTRGKCSYNNTTIQLVFCTNQCRLNFTTDCNTVNYIMLNNTYKK